MHMVCMIQHVEVVDYGRCMWCRCMLTQTYLSKSSQEPGSKMSQMQLSIQVCPTTCMSQCTTTLVAEHSAHWWFQRVGHNCWKIILSKYSTINIRVTQSFTELQHDSIQCQGRGLRCCTDSTSPAAYHPAGFPSRTDQPAATAVCLLVTLVKDTDRDRDDLPIHGVDTGHRCGLACKVNA